MLLLTNRTHAYVMHRSDLQALQALHQMEALDVSGNNLHDMQALEAIKHMPRLFSLQLKGNPICLQVYYPYEIFLLQPSLQYVDSW